MLRDLCVLRLTKDLSFGERKMLDTARGLLINELAIAEDTSLSLAWLEDFGSPFLPFCGSRVEGN